MPGLYFDLNLHPGLQAASKRLSFSGADADADSPSPSSGRGGRAQRGPQWKPTLETIGEGSRTSHDNLSQHNTPPSSPAGAPVATSLSLAPPGPSQSQQLQEAAAAARMFGEYQQQAWASAGRPQQQALMLYTLDGGSAGYETKWEELHAVSQRLLLQIENNIREYRDDSERLDACSRLDDLSPFSFEFDAAQITQEVVSVSTLMNREKVSIESLMTVIKEIMMNTDFAIRSYAKLRPSATRRPSPFLQHTVARFEDHLGECCKWILELEQLVQMKNDKTFAESLESLSKVLSNAHDYLIHVASKTEHIHQGVETMKTQYLNDRRCRGDLSNPFLKANRREEAKQEATASITHPMLHLSPPGQPTTLAAVPMISNQLQQTPFPTVATSPSSYPTLPLPSVLPPSSMRTSPAPLTNRFSSPGSVMQSPPFGSFSTIALGSTPAASLLGTGIPSSPTSLFPIPSGGGTAVSGINPVPTGRRKPIRRNH
ncbi:unnamed protein product [Urochloa humidicola]